MRLTLTLCLVFAAGCNNDLERRLEANDKRLAALEEELSRTKQSMARQGEKMAQVEEEVAGLGESTQAHARQLKDIVGKVSGLETAARARGNELGALRGEVKGLRKKQSQVLHVWDGADQLIGKVIEQDNEGVLFTMPDIEVPLFTELLVTHQFALYYTGANCTGAPVAIVEATGGLLGFLKQSTGELFLPNGKYARRQVASAGRLTPQGGCVSVSGTYNVEELEVAVVLEPFAPGVRVAEQ